jgi:hypothetical protein
MFISIRRGCHGGSCSRAIMAEAAKEDEEQQAAEAEEVAAANRVWLRQGTQRSTTW